MRMQTLPAILLLLPGLALAQAPRALSGADIAAALANSGTVLPAARLPTGPGGVGLLDSTGKFPSSLIPSGSGGVAGSQGPIGLTGPTGPQGPAGSAGAAGPAGSVVAATTTTLGGIKCGTGLICAADGMASVDSQPPVASSAAPVAATALVDITGHSFTVQQIAAAVASINAAGGGTTPAPSPSGAGLTLASATFGASATGFGQQLTGGSGSATIALPAGDFTLELWFTGGTTTAFHVMAAMLDGSGATMGAIGIGATELFALAGTGSTQTAVTIADGTRHHLVVQSSAATTSVKAFVDGVPRANFGPANAAAGATIQIAAAGGTAAANPGWGSVDEVRLSKGTRYDPTGFTPPTAPFTTDANTVALYHLDGTGAAN